MVYPMILLILDVKIMFFVMGLFYAKLSLEGGTEGSLKNVGSYYAYCQSTIATIFIVVD